MFRNRIELLPNSRLEYGGPVWIIDDSPGKRVILIGLHLATFAVEAWDEGIEGPLTKSPGRRIKDARSLALVGTGYLE